MAFKKSSRMAQELFISHYDAPRPVDWQAQFGSSRGLNVEIGFGLGEFLLSCAQDSPDENFVGIESDWTRVKKTLRRVEAANRALPAEHRIDNIRVLQVDAVVAFERLFEPKTIKRVFALFPCPWPKKKHVKHRLFSHLFFRLLNSRLTDSGEVKIVTDHKPFWHWMLYEVDGTGFDVQTQHVGPQFDTKYERKWCEGGQKTFYVINLSKRTHMEVPLKEDVQLRTYFSDMFIPENFEFPDIIGDVSIILKDFLFDEKRQAGMAHLVVAEETITQHVWIVIVRCDKGWCIAKAQGHTALPTRGISRAIQAVHKAVERTKESLIPTV